MLNGIEPVFRRKIASARRSEAGSAMILIPCLTLVIVLAAGLVIDSAVGFTAKRALVDAATAAANDAANAVDDDPLYAEGRLGLDETLVSRLASESIAPRLDNLSDVTVSAAIVRRNGRQAVHITVTGTTHTVFHVVPGIDEWTLRAEATSTAHEGT